MGSRWGRKNQPAFLEEALLDLPVDLHTGIEQGRCSRGGVSTRVGLDVLSRTPSLIKERESRGREKGREIWHLCSSPQVVPYFVYNLMKVLQFH